MPFQHHTVHCIFGLLIFRKIVRIVATRGQAPPQTKLGSLQQRSPDPLAGFGGGRATSKRRGERREGKEREREWRGGKDRGGNVE